MNEPTQAVLVHMPISLVEALDKIAMAHGMSRSELIRLTLKLHQDPSKILVVNDLTRSSTKSPDRSLWSWLAPSYWFFHQR